MLEALRKNSRNTIIYVLFGVIIAVFVINFGPGSQGCDSSGGRAYAAKVAGITISENQFRYAYVTAENQMRYMFGGQFSARDYHLKEQVMNQLIDTELAAQEAESLGLEVSDNEISEMIERGRYYFLGAEEHTDAFNKDGVFNYEKLQSFCKNRLNVSVATFIELQRRDRLADHLRKMMIGGLKVSTDEVKAEYEQRERKANLEFVRLAARRDEVELGTEEIEAYRKAHEAEVKRSYDDHPYLYKKLEPHAHLRRILVGVAKDAAPAVVAKAKAKIEDAARRIQAGQPFAAVVKALSEEEATRLRGGDLGWHKKGFSGLGEAIDTRAFAAPPGALIGPEKTARGFELVKVEGFRKGDVALGDAALEIAEDLLRTERAQAAAKKEAEAVLAKLKQGAKLADLFPKKSGEETPAAKETGLFARHNEMVPEVGLSAALAAQAFTAPVGQAIGPLEVAGNQVVAVIKERKEPEPFDKKQADEERQAERRQAREVLTAWTKERCVEVRDAGRIKVNDELLSYDGGGRGAGVKYQPCAKL